MESDRSDKSSKGWPNRKRSSSKGRNLVASQGSTPQPELTEPVLILKNEFANGERKGKFSSFKKVLTPFRTVENGSELDRTQLPRGRAVVSQQHPENELSTETDEPPTVSKKDPTNITSKRGKSIIGHIDDIEDKEQWNSTTGQDLSVLLQERVGNLELQKKKQEDSYQQRIRSLEEKIQILYTERNEARQFEEDSLNLYEKLKNTISGQKGAETKQISTNQVDQELTENVSLLQRYRKEVDQFDRKNNQLKKDGYLLQQKNNDLEAKLKDQTDEWRQKSFRYTEDLIRLEQKATRLSQEVERARESELEALKETKRLRMELDRIVQDRATEVAGVDHFYFDDSYFITQFGILRSSIKAWANRAFSLYDPKGKKKPSAAVIRDLSLVSKHWETYMDSDVHRPTFIQACIWHFLSLRVFNGQFWNNPSGSITHVEMIRDLNPRENTAENQKAFHEWRYTGARYVGPIGTEAQLKERITLKSSYELITALVDPLDHWSAMGETQSHNCALNIIMDAILLDLKMLQQKAFFPPFGSMDLKKRNNGRFNPGTMEARSGETESDRAIVLVIAPMLLKCGDSQGGNYEHSVVLEKALVDIDLPKGKRLGRF